MTEEVKPKRKYKPYKQFDKRRFRPFNDPYRDPSEIEYLYKIKSRPMTDGRSVVGWATSKIQARRVRWRLALYYHLSYKHGFYPISKVSFAEIQTLTLLMSWLNLYWRYEIPEGAMKDTVISSKKLMLEKPLKTLVRNEPPDLREVEVVELSGNVAPNLNATNFEEDEENGES